VVFFVAFSATSSALAAAPPLDAYIDNQQGIKAFKDGNFEEAKQRFGAAQARDPNSPELHFNQGVIQLQQGNTDAAAAEFQNAERAAQEKGDPKLSAILYNLE